MKNLVSQNMFLVYVVAICFGISLNILMNPKKDFKKVKSKKSQSPAVKTPMNWVRCGENISDA